MGFDRHFDCTRFLERLDTETDEVVGEIKEFEVRELAPPGA
jgi:hypothetical protein